jgi:hypothetical protein
MNSTSNAGFGPVLAVRSLLSDLTVPWIAGGWAIDLAVGCVTGDHDVPRMSRRRFLNTAAAGLGAASAGLAASCSGPGAGTASPGRQAPAGRDLTGTVLEAFQTRRLVGLGESHDLQNHHDALEMLLRDPRLPEVADDLVVEFGNAFYQDTIDRFIAGQPVADADLRLVWRNTTQSPLNTWDAPVYEQFYRTVRAANWALPTGRQMRVLLGDPPAGWPASSDMYAASVVEKQVLAQGRRALLCYGSGHLLRPAPQLPHAPASLAGIIEQRTGERIYTITDLVPFAGDPGGLARKLSRYPRDTVIPTAGTWLGAFDAGLAVAVLRKARNGEQFNPYRGVPLGSLQDAGLYLGQPGDLTASWPNPAIYLDPAYWRELQRRNAQLGNPVNLDSYRQEQAPQYPLPRLPSSPECGQAAPAGS